MIFDRHVNLKYKYRNRHFWCRGYYVDILGKYENAIKKYIKNQLEEDMIIDQMSLKTRLQVVRENKVKIKASKRGLVSKKM